MRRSEVAIALPCSDRKRQQLDALDGVSRPGEGPFEVERGPLCEAPPEGLGVGRVVWSLAAVEPPVKLTPKSAKMMGAPSGVSIPFASLLFPSTVGRVGRFHGGPPDGGCPAANREIRLDHPHRGRPRRRPKCHLGASSIDAPAGWGGHLQCTRSTAMRSQSSSPAALGIATRNSSPHSELDGVAERMAQVLRHGSHVHAFAAGATIPTPSSPKSAPSADLPLHLRQHPLIPASTASLA